MKSTVLMADDEEGILALVVATLGQDQRDRLLLAGDGEEALTMALRERPDLLFLDVVMPRLDGYEVCRRLKTDPSTCHVRVIMLTALAQEMDRRKAMEVGADDYLTKPFSPMALLKKVEDFLVAR